MKLTEEAIKEFQAIAKEEYGIDLSHGDATVIGTRLLLLYELICKSLPNELPTPPLSAQPLPDDRAQAAF
jgi:hypothetical protein